MKKHWMDLVLMSGLGAGVHWVWTRDVVSVDAQARTQTVTHTARYQRLARNPDGTYLRPRWVVVLVTRNGIVQTPMVDYAESTTAGKLFPIGWVDGDVVTAFGFDVVGVGMGVGKGAKHRD